MNDTEKNWLVKSSTRILGPFTLAELTEQLRTRQISIIDEIRRPDGRWSYVRENKVLMDVVKNIRDEQDAQHENTMTQSVAQHTAITRTDALVDDVTKTPVASNFDLTPPPPVQENIKDVTPNVAVPSPRSSSAVRVSTKNYGTAEDYRLQGRLKRKSKLLQWGIVVASFAVAGIVSFGVAQKNKKRILGAGELLSQALRYKTLGLYEKSLSSYLKASSIKEPDFDTQIQMAPVLISEDRQSLQGRRILERALIQEDRGRTETVDAYLGIAVSYIMDGDLKQAEDTLQKAIGYDPLNLSALLNLGIIHLKKGSYEEAMQEFESIYHKNPQSALALFGHAMATVELSKAKSDTVLLQNLINDMKVNLQRSYNLRQELLLFNVYAFSLLNDVDGLNQAVGQFLSQASGQSKNFVHPLQVEWRFTQWDYLERYCSDVFQKSPPNPELKAFRSVCLMEVHRDVEAGKLLQEALAEAPKDPFVLITQASYLAKVERLPEAMVILKMPELAGLPAKNFLQGDICIRSQDVLCAKDAYNQLYGTDPVNAIVLYGLAWVSKHENNRMKALDYVNAGLKSESNFLPLLELRDQLESE
ncbi:MAG: tetratricopeptide repeat protein [Pseudobdellovibrionaceae bacterium]